VVGFRLIASFRVRFRVRHKVSNRIGVRVRIRDAVWGRYICK